MKKYAKWLIIVFLILIVIKVILSSFILTPTQFADEYFYQRMAQSFFNQGQFLIDESPSTAYLPLYPITISPAFVFNDMQNIYFFMKVINCILSSTILFAGFLLAKEFMTRKKAFLVSIVLSLVPPIFGFFPFLMSENLFYPLFLFTIYFMYKSFVEKEKRWLILTGLFIGLCSLTKITGLILVFIFAIILTIKLIKEKKILNFLKAGFLSGLAFIAVYGWWLLRNYFIFKNFFGGPMVGVGGVSYNDVLSNLVKEFSVTKLLIIFANYFSYFALSLFIIFLIYALISYKKGNYSYFYLIGLICSVP